MTPFEDFAEPCGTLATGGSARNVFPGRHLQTTAEPGVLRFRKLKARCSHKLHPECGTLGRSTQRAHARHLLTGCAHHPQGASTHALTRICPRYGGSQVPHASQPVAKSRDKVRNLGFSWFRKGSAGSARQRLRVAAFLLCDPSCRGTERVSVVDLCGPLPFVVRRGRCLEQGGGVPSPRSVACIPPNSHCRLSRRSPLVAHPFRPHITNPAARPPGTTPWFIVAATLFALFVLWLCLLAS